MKLKLATIAIASLLSLGAHATTTDWGVHAPLEVAATITPIGSFEDTYLFSLVGAYSVFSTSVANDLTQVLGISDGLVSLFETVGAVNSSVGSYAFDDTTGDISHSFGTLAGGNYFYQVTGTGTGTMGGFYSLSSTVSPVPELHSYLLMLAGLGAIGFLIRRRSW